MLSESDKANIRKIADNSEKLLKETYRLRADVLRLHGRIEPFDDEKHVIEFEHSFPKTRVLKDFLDEMTVSLRNLKEVEYDLSAIRSFLDTVSKDAVSREDWKPFIDSKD